MTLSVHEEGLSQKRVIGNTLGIYDYFFIYQSRSERVRDCCLKPIQQLFSHIINGEIKLIFNEMMMRSVL